MLELKNHFEKTVPVTVDTIARKQTDQLKNQNNASNILIEPLAIGTIVYVKNDGLLTKMESKFKGPYTITEQTAIGNYKLKDAAGTILTKSYPLEKLKITKDMETSQIYAVEKILNDRVYKQQQQYLVKWKDFEDTHNSWEFEANFVNSIPIQIYWDSKSNLRDASKPVRRSKRIQKVNTLFSFNSPGIPVKLICIIITLSIFKIINCTKIRENFKYCEGRSNSHVVDLRSPCTLLASTNTKFKQLGLILDKNQRANGLFTIAKKLNHMVSGSGFQCRVEKLSIITYTSLFFEQTERVHHEFVDVSKDECWYMIRSKKCRDRVMTCDDSSCSYKPKITAYFRWLESLKFESYSCTVVPRIVQANKIDDPLFGDSLPICTASDLSCQRDSHIIVWTKDVIHTCPFEAIHTSNMTLQRDIVISKTDHLLFQVTEISSQCGKAFIHTNQGLYLYHGKPGESSLRQSKSTLKDIQDLQLADEDYLSYQFLQITTNLQKSWCHQAISLIYSFSKLENEYSKISDIKGNNIILYSVNRQVYIPQCFNINEVEIVPFTKHCYNDIPVTFVFKNKSINAFLQADLIIKRVSSLVDCTSVTYKSWIINSQFEIQQNGTTITVNKPLHFSPVRLNLINSEMINFNSHHVHELIESVDVLADRNNFKAIQEESGNFLISTNDLSQSKNIIIQPLQNIVDHANHMVSQTKQKINYVVRITTTIVVSFLVILIILIFLVLFRRHLKQMISKSTYKWTNFKRRSSLENPNIENQESLVPLTIPSLYPNVTLLMDTPPTESKIQVPAPDYDTVSQNTRKLVFNIVKQIPPN